MSRYWIRWKLEYFNKPSVHGPWNKAPKGQESWRQGYEGVSHAVIERFDSLDSSTKEVIRVPGSEFRCFQALGAINLSAALYPQRIPPTIIGMIIVGTNNCYRALTNGKIQKLATPEQYNKLMFHRGEEV